MSMKITKSGTLSYAQKEQVCMIWNNEYPQKLAINPTAFDEFLQVSTGHTHYLIVEDNRGIIGWADTFDRGGDRWFSIIIDGSHQRKGLGHLLLNLIKEKENRLNGWVIDHHNDIKQNGEPYLSPLSFYVRNGFAVHPGTRLEDEKISALKIEWRKS